MEKEKSISLDSKFARGVHAGLTDFPKHLSSKFIYDEKGDKLFQDIMAMPAYYLTDCEFDILSRHQQLISENFSNTGGFVFIELGAGDGKKTKILLKSLVQNNYDFDYLPVDISQNALDGLEQSLREEIPKVSVKPVQGTYFSVLADLAKLNTRKKAIVVLGSNIGNLHHNEAIEFLRNIRKAMRRGDMLFMGFDQKKNPQVILDAYNDENGITEAFNKNILERINREFDGNFDPEKFMHWETYNPETGTAKSFLLSKIAQEVTLPKLDLTVQFARWESIHTEISQKYNDDVVQWLAGEAGLQIKERFEDKKGYYKDYIFQKE